MYLHLGCDIVITGGDIVAVCDIDRATVSRTTRDYLTNAEKNGETVNLNSNLPKSFVLCARKKKKKQKVYITQVSSQTLFKRSLRKYDDTL